MVSAWGGRLETINKFNQVSNLPINPNTNWTAKLRWAFWAVRTPWERNTSLRTMEASHLKPFQIATHAFSKSSWNTWKFSVHVLSKPSLENFEHYFDSEWNEYNCAIVWTFFGIAFLWVVMKADFFQSCGHCWVFQICWHIHVGSDQIHLDRIEPLLCIISSSLILTALSFALASVLQLSSVRFSCSLSIPTDRMWAPHPGEQVHQCDETRPCHKPSSCPPLTMT